MLKNFKKIKTIAPSIITAEMQVTGDIIGAGAVEVDGTITGQIKCLSVKLGNGSKVIGDITAEKAEIHGEVVGNIIAKTIICGSDAKVTGDIIHQNIELQNGAVIEGSCTKFIQDEPAAVEAVEDIKQAS